MISLFAAAAAITDLVIKARIEATPENHLPRTVAGGHIQLDRFHNYGFSLSRGEEHPELVTAAVAGTYTYVLGRVLQRKFETGRALSPGTALILSGGFSNLFDRLTRGYVVDYIRFPRTRFHHLIMNIGDLCLLLGCLFMAEEEILHDQ